jgi:glycosyltransferase involved in cell wall biosynthesis
MIPIYSVLIAPWCRLFSKRLIQWYTHSSVDFRLKLANLVVDNFVTASKESFRLKTKKPVKILGHGIDTAHFAPQSEQSSKFIDLAKRSGAGKIQNSKSIFNIISIGRISPTKDYESMIKAIYELKGEGFKNIQLTIIGNVGLKSQESYLESLKQMVKKMNLQPQVKFLGAIPNLETPPYLQKSDLFINLSGTGSLDKAPLEAMACQVLVLTSNQAFKSILPEALIVVKDQPDKLAQKIKYIINLSVRQKSELQKRLRRIVVENHNLDKLIGKIIRLYK